MKNFQLRFLLLLLAALLANTANAQVKDPIDLPELGDASSALFSLEKEYQLGRAWLRAFRSRVDIVSDPLLQDYVEELTYRLATHSELKDRRLDIIIVNNRKINAFAALGGVLGIHNGLLLQAETEAQFASVMSHELAHLSQRHFARNVEAQKRNAIPTMAGLLAGFILAATDGGSSGMAAIAATQAANLQSQLRYSRLHEQEADRAGMQTMMRADMDPNAAVGMFEVMQQASRYDGNRPPEFLLTHPVTESRISDARNRSRQYPRKMYTDNPHFQLMRTKVALSFIESSKEAVKYFRAKQTSPGRYPDADQYGLVLALTANSEFNEAQQRLNQLMTAAPNEISYLLAQAELDMASGKWLQAITRLENALALTPDSHPITMTLARSYLLANQPHKAEALLEHHTQVKPNEPSVWHLLAETHGLAGNIVGVHRARAEYFVLKGVLDKAAKRLNYALPLVKNDDLTTVKIEQRIMQIRRMKTQMKNL